MKERERIMKERERMINIGVLKRKIKDHNVTVYCIV